MLPRPAARHLALLVGCGIGPCARCQIMLEQKTNRVWRLHNYPEENDFGPAILLHEESLQELREGEVLIANRWLSLDAGTRMWMTPRTDSYQPPIPLGSIVPGQVLGRVVASRAERFAEGN